MAQRVITTTVSDLSGKDDATEVPFSFEGQHYVIDLTESEVEQMRRALKKYVGAARKAPRTATNGVRKRRT